MNEYYFEGVCWIDNTGLIILFVNFFTKGVKLKFVKKFLVSFKLKFMSTKMAEIVRKLISTSKAAKPVAPYNQAVVVDRTVYVSGCLGLDKVTKQLVTGGVAEQTRQALHNLTVTLEAAGSGIDKIVKNTVFVKDLNDFGIVNEEYKKVFTDNCPARSCVQVARLPMDALVEIESIALTGNVRTEIISD